MSPSRVAETTSRAAKTANRPRAAAFAALIERYRETDERTAARQALMTASVESAPSTISCVGFDGGALAFFLAAVFDPGEGPTLVVTATQDEGEQLRDELAEFTGRTCLFFPPWESLFHDDSIPDEEIYHDRLRVLERLDGLDRAGSIAFVVAPVHALIQPVASRSELSSASFFVETGNDLPRDDLASRLASMSFRHVPLVLGRGEFSVRGDILDLFPFDGRHPLRIEFFGDTVDSIREFDPDSQRSIPGREVDRQRIVVPSQESMFRAFCRDGDSILLDSFPQTSRVVISDPEAFEERARQIFHNLVDTGERGRSQDGAEGAAESFLARIDSRRRVDAFPLALPVGVEGQSLEFGSVGRFGETDLETTMEAISETLAAGDEVAISCESEAERRRVQEILADHEIDRSRVILGVSLVRRGFESRALRSVLLTTRELFNRRTVRRSRRAPVETRVVRGFFELDEGDLVVHLAHGIGRYLGVRQMRKDGVVQEFLEIEYRNRVKVYVPASRIDLVQKYVGSGAYEPNLDKVGGTSWTRRKDQVANAVHDFAAELLDIQALRQERPGVAYEADTDWQRQLEASFPYEDTADQHEATLAIKSDLESTQPMDRLLCGDVGYGKTEIAARAAFKVVNSGRQVGILVPTTVLAQQHARTFRERMAGFPIRIEQLSRFCTRREQREIVEATGAGSVDILIGTHRILSDDVSFKELGLVVIDEEQRFGVAHKEKLKKMRAMVEILTMTATPIPRTLHMALLGIRDISSLSTPPEGRSPIETHVMEFDRPRIREAILRELNREGQIYFVHNRVLDIYSMQQQLQQLIPEARIEFAHGQMSEHQLEKIMVRFLDHDIDVLLSTTIIESGIDIPNVNTIFVNECDRYGLAGLHQLRGRVGRSRHKAYCYLILPEHRHINPDAKKRLQSIREFSQLGAGFQIAMRDLEIRGAGNILGSEQSGHIVQVGYDLYCRLLERAVNGLKGEDRDDAVDVEIDLNLEAFIPKELVADESTRLDIYRRLSKVQDVDGVEEMAREVRDRFGSLPLPVERLLELQILRILAAQWSLRSVAFDESGILLDAGEKMKALLDNCPLRVVVLAPTQISLVVNEPTGKGRRIELDDVTVFRTMLEWLKTGTFPSLKVRRPRPAMSLSKNPSSDRGRAKRRLARSEEESI